MQQLFYDSWADALKEVINALGGSRQVAQKLWPEKAPDSAQRLLSDCLNEHRPERLDPDRLVLLLRMGRDKGCHAGANWLLRELGYEDAKVFEPADAREKLMRDFIEAQRSLAALASRIEAVTPR